MCMHLCQVSSYKIEMFKEFVSEQYGTDVYVISPLLFYIKFIGILNNVFSVFSMKYFFKTGRPVIHTCFCKLH